MMASVSSVIPAQAGTHVSKESTPIDAFSTQRWVPACAGMTPLLGNGFVLNISSYRCAQLLIDPTKIIANYLSFEQS
jgi:hypothetical protein